MRCLQSWLRGHFDATYLLANIRLRCRFLVFNETVNSFTLIASSQSSCLFAEEQKQCTMASEATQ